LRISDLEIQNLKNSIYQFDKNAEIYLFGSRINDTQKGGDIDILIISQKITRKEKRTIRINFFQEFGEQKLDIIIEKSKNSFSNFTKTIFKKAIKL
jgi:predicted nucleotidyltransferase